MTQSVSRSHELAALPYDLAPISLKRRLWAIGSHLGHRAEIAIANLTPGSGVSYPEFLCIGVQRSATTWLYEQLRRHRQIFLPARKELHFFDEPPPDMAYHLGAVGLRPYYFDDRKDSHQRWYKRNFRGAADRTAGDFTPSYSLLSPEKIARIADMMPTVKIILILRDPVDRAWSALRLAWLRQMGEPLPALDDDRMLRLVRNPRILRHGDYASILENWGRFVPPERFLKILYDDIRRDPLGQLELTASFLGLSPALSPGVEPSKERTNHAPGAGMPSRVRHALCAHYSETVAFVARELGRDLSHWARPDA